MEKIIIGQNFLNFLFFVCFPILAIKILSLGFQNFIPHKKIEDFFIFLTVSIIEIILVSIWIFKSTKTVNILLTLSIFFYIISINTINLFKMSNYWKKNSNLWLDFFEISFLSIILFSVLIFYIKFKFF